jgi:hypothetical protein
MVSNEINDEIGHCTKCTNELITDNNPLCPECEINTMLVEHLQNAKTKYELLKTVNSKEKLIEYLNERINKGNNTIVQTINGDSQHSGDNYRKNRNKVILSWKMCVEYYTKELINLTNLPSKDNGKTALAVILKAYFENNCKKITQQKVESLINEGFSRTTLVNKWKDLQKDDYTHKENTNNIQSFRIAYNYLKTEFATEGKKKELLEVEIRLKILNETYPE